MGLRVLLSTTVGKLVAAGVAAAVIGGAAGGAAAVMGGAAGPAVAANPGSGRTDSTRTNGAPQVSCRPPVAPDPILGLLIVPNPTAVPAPPTLQVAVDARQCDGKPLSATAVTLSASGASFSPSTKLSTPCGAQRCTVTTDADGIADVNLLVTAPPGASPAVCTPEDVTGTPNSCLATILRANVSVTAKVMSTTATAGPDLIRAATMTNQGSLRNDSVREPVAFTIGYPPGMTPPQNPAWPKEISCEGYNTAVNVVAPAAGCAATIAVSACLAAGAAGGAVLDLPCASTATFVGETAAPDCVNALLAGVEQYLAVGQAAPPPDNLAGYLEQIPTVWCSVYTATSLQIAPAGDKVLITADDDAGNPVPGTPVYLATAGTLAGGTAAVSGSSGCFQPVSGVPLPCPPAVTAAGVGFVTGASGLTITYTAPASAPPGESERLLVSLGVLSTAANTLNCPAGLQAVTGISAVACTPLQPPVSGTTVTPAPTPATSGPPQNTAADVAADEAAVTAAFGGCTAFSQTGCPMTAVTTPDGHGGRLIAIGVQVTGDGYQAVIFFDDTTGVGQTGTTSYPPFGPRLGPGAPKYARIGPGGPEAFEVDWYTWSRSHFQGFCCPNGPLLTWNYQWNGSAMQASGQQPPAGYEF